MKTEQLHGIERPRLLMATAKEYINRQQFFGTMRPKLPDDAVEKLIKDEAQLEEWRKEKSDQYKIDRHIKLLAALITQAHWRLPKAS